MKKKIALLMACVMAFGVAVGGTLAWLTAKTEPVTNVFTPSDITITLQEHTYNAEEDKLTTTETTEGVSNYKMVPGHTIPKDPWVTVKAGSEACWLFVKVVESVGGEGLNKITVDGTDYNFDSYMTYAVITGENGWTELDATNHPGVYYREVAAAESDQTFEVIFNDIDGDGNKDSGEEANVTSVKTTVTKEMMNALDNGAKYPKLTFTAYAVQYNNSNTTNFSAIDAWKESAGYVDPNA